MITDRFIELGYTHSNLIALIKASGIGKAELAKATGVNVATARRWLVGEHGMPSKTWVRVVNACGSYKPIQPL